LTSTYLKPLYWSIPIGKLLQRIWPLGAWLSRWTYQTVEHYDYKTKLDIIIGSGGSLLWHTAALAKSHDAVSIFSGSKHALPKGAIQLLGIPFRELP